MDREQKVSMEAVFEIINNEYVSECFFKIATMEETIY